MSFLKARLNSNCKLLLVLNTNSGVQTRQSFSDVSQEKQRLPGLFSPDFLD